MCILIPWYNRSRHGVVDKPISIPGSSSLSEETKPWPRLYMTLTVGGTLNINSLTLVSPVFVRFDSLRPINNLSVM